MFTLKRKKNRRIAERKTENKFYRYIAWKPIGVGILLWLITMILFLNDEFIPSVNLIETQKAPRTILSSVPFDYVNIKLTQIEKNNAKKNILPIFNIEESSQKLALQRIRSLCSRLQQYFKSDSFQKNEIEQSIADIIIGSDLTSKEIIDVFEIEKSILDPISRNITSFEKELNNVIIKLYKKGIISNDDLKGVLSDQKNLTIFSINKNTYQTSSTNNIFSVNNAINQLSNISKSTNINNIVTKLGSILILPSLVYDSEKTIKEIDEALISVDPIIERFPSDSRLIKKGEIITKHHIELLKSHEKQLLLERDPSEQQLQMIGKSILLLSALIATVVMLRLLSYEIIFDTEKLILLSVLSLITLGSARLLSYISIQTEIISSSVLIFLVPHALAILLGTVLLGGGAALSLGFWGSFATAVYFDESFSVFVLGIFTTITATTAARNLHKRSNLYRAGFFVALSNIIFTLIIYIFSQPELPILGKQLIGSIISAAISTILALLLIPLFEKLFKITTDITLLELSDMGHPLLQKMAIQAPGTYHHSLMVATLAQNAAESIKANSLMVRVCAYYHDIGKLVKPEFFAENIRENDNPHDDLSPHMSAIIIIAHVKEGLALAKKYKLPLPILEAIEQHHGNSLISYFYNKAKNQLSEQNSIQELNEADFRYGGQLPVSPEMAILSLADASEAASRSIKKVSPQKIKNLIDEIFETKLYDGQLDNALLTMAQINTIKESIVFSLSNMLHGRVSYKNDKDQPNKSAK